MFSSGSFFGLGGSVVTSASRKDEPYGGQKVCPVTGNKLGSMGQPVAVDTGIGARQPSALGKLFGRKATPGIVIYVCCQNCAAKVKSDPGAYVTKVIAEANGWSQDNPGASVIGPAVRR